MGDTQQHRRVERGKRRPRGCCAAQGGTLGAAAASGIAKWSRRRRRREQPPTWSRRMSRTKSPTVTWRPRDPGLGVNSCQEGTSARQSRKQAGRLVGGRPGGARALASQCGGLARYAAALQPCIHSSTFAAPPRALGGGSRAPPSATPSPPSAAFASAHSSNAQQRQQQRQQQQRTSGSRTYRPHHSHSARGLHTYRRYRNPTCGTARPACAQHSTPVGPGAAG